MAVPHQQLFNNHGFLIIANSVMGQPSPSVTLSLKPAIAAGLSSAVNSTLTDMKIDPATTPLTGAVNRVFSLITALSSREVQIDFGRMPPDPEDPTFEQPPKPALPTSHGNLNPIGVADLLVVKQQLIRYERGEVAHIENILAGESFKRAVTRTETEDITIVTETESTRDEERDLQSTERFELQEEVRSVVTEDGKLKAGAPLSPAYGPMLEFTSDKDNPTFGSLNVSMNQAASHGRDVTERATSRITERIRRQLTQRLVRTFKEKTEHSFANVEGASKNISGIYQWIDKIYQAQVYNYGKRLFYDFTIPEPGAFILSACEAKRPTKPIPFDLVASEITEFNYYYWAALYDVAGIVPPPPAVRTKSYGFDISTNDRHDFAIASKLIDLPLGYFAFQLRDCYFSSDGDVRIKIGDAYFFNLWVFDGRPESLSLVCEQRNSSGVTVTFNIVCKRTEEYFAQWKSKTHQIILDGYLKKLSEYEERLANIEALMRYTGQGTSPEINRIREREELKKTCIELFTRQQFDVFNEVEYSSQGIPQPYFDAVELLANYTRFFEQAFEWEQMIYYLYSYFWGRKSHWKENYLIADNDPQREAFLKAGSARVLVPAKPGFERALASFSITGKLPTTDELADITHARFAAVKSDLETGGDFKDEGLPYGKPWKLRLPTTLVQLRADDKLPKWKQNATTHEWEPDEI